MGAEGDTIKEVQQNRQTEQNDKTEQTVGEAFGGTSDTCEPPVLVAAHRNRMELLQAAYRIAFQ